MTDPISNPPPLPPVKPVAAQSAIPATEPAGASMAVTTGGEQPPPPGPRPQSYGDRTAPSAVELAARLASVLGKRGVTDPAAVAAEALRLSPAGQVERHTRLALALVEAGVPPQSDLLAQAMAILDGQDETRDVFLRVQQALSEVEAEGVRSPVLAEARVALDRAVVVLTREDRAEALSARVRDGGVPELVRAVELTAAAIEQIVEQDEVLLRLAKIEDGIRTAIQEAGARSPASPPLPSPSPAPSLDVPRVPVPVPVPAPAPAPAPAPSVPPPAPQPPLDGNAVQDVARTEPYLREVLRAAVLRLFGEEAAPQATPRTVPASIPPEAVAAVEEVLADIMPGLLSRLAEGLNAKSESATASAGVIGSGEVPAWLSELLRALDAAWAPLQGAATPQSVTSAGSGPAPSAGLPGALLGPAPWLAIQEALHGLPRPAAPKTVELPAGVIDALVRHIAGLSVPAGAGGDGLDKLLLRLDATALRTLAGAVEHGEAFMASPALSGAEEPRLEGVPFDPMARVRADLARVLAALGVRTPELGPVELAGYLDRLAELALRARGALEARAPLALDKAVEVLRALLARPGGHFDAGVREALARAAERGLGVVQRAVERLESERLEGFRVVQALAGAHEELRGVLDRMQGFRALQQAVQQSSWDGALAEVVVALGGEVQPVRMRLYRDRKAAGERKEPVHRAVLDLKLKRLGRIRSLVELSGMKVDVGFALEAGKARDLVRRNLGSLHEGLSNLGLSPRLAVESRKLEEAPKPTDGLEETIAGKPTEFWA